MAVFNEPAQWDHTLGNNADTSTLPDDAAATAGIASLQKLFQLINQTPLEAGGIAPAREDVNALFKYLGDQIFYTQNGGVPSYNAAYDYIPGRVVLYTDNKLYKCIQANGASSTIVAPDSVSPLGSDYWKDIENQDSTSLIPNQLIMSPVPLTDANLHLLDGALLSGSGAYSAYVAMMADLYNADPTATCWTDEASWQASVTTYGECGKFVYDSVNNTLRLPKVASFVQATTTANELGTLVEAGAPNIQANYIGDNVGTIDLNAGGSVEGAFVANVGAYRIIAQSTYDPTGAAQLGLDASRSSSVYGNSNTIQPQAIKYYFYIVVGTVSKTDIQIDIDNVMTDLALKADKDFSNVTAPVQAFKDMSIEWGLPDYTAGINITTLPYTAPNDGYINILCNANNSTCVLQVNTTPITILDTIGGITSGLFFKVKKGDILATNSANTATVPYNNSGRNEYSMFYPCKGAN